MLAKAALNVQGSIPYKTRQHHEHIKIDQNASTKPISSQSRERKGKTQSCIKDNTDLTINLQTPLRQKFETHGPNSVTSLERVNV